MTMALDVREALVKRAMEIAGTQSPREAIVKALEQYGRAHSQADLIKYLGTFDDMITPEELDEMRSMD